MIIIKHTDSDEQKEQPETSFSFTLPHTAHVLIKNDDLRIKGMLGHELVHAQLSLCEPRSVRLDIDRVRD